MGISVVLGLHFISLAVGIALGFFVLPMLLGMLGKRSG